MQNLSENGRKYTPGGVKYAKECFITLTTECLTLLLNHGSSADIKDLENKTPLYYALEVYSVPLILTLLSV